MMSNELSRIQENLNDIAAGISKLERNVYSTLSPRKLVEEVQKGNALVINEANCDYIDDNDRNLLHHTTRIGVARKLLEHGVDPHAKDSEGDSAYDFAVEEGRDDLIELFDSYA
jgi:ankyrin repeat protein